ncbi:3-keto-5-aminohexanoate cleavage protein [Rhizobium sp. BR 317]|uniref:3-keto-5-aminohexanoate cleavage protein n=1 Tax=Rhizobium sp. BR 317 TaxID=3040015 RepID=UPI0039BF7F71
MPETTITVAPNGGRRTKQDHPAIPLTAAELARTARECLEAGASMIHVHVRKSDGTHLLDADAYRSAIAAIRAEVGDRMVIQITSEALGVYSPAEQIAVVKAVRPQAASLALRELVPDASHDAAFADLLAWMQREDVLPQIILYEPAEAIRLAEYRQRGLLAFDDVPVLYVLGRYTVGQTSAPTDLLPFLALDMPRFSHWSVCAFGRDEAACVTAGALLGGHARVGFENNLYRVNGHLAASNADLVRDVESALRHLGLRR